MNENKTAVTEITEDGVDRPKRLLLVDDDPAIRKVLAIGFQLEGFQTMEASDGQSALDILADQSVDLMLVDLMMPVMNGVTLISKVRKDLELEVPVFMLTSFDREGSEDDAMKAGATALIRKPANVREILRVLGAHQA